MRDHLGWITALAIAFFALAQRVERLDFFWLNQDEGIYWTVAHGDLAQAHSMVAANAHPPLYYYLLRAATAFGDGAEPLRMPSALFGSLAVFAAYLAGRQLQGRIGGLIAAFLLAVSPGALRLSAVARPYMAQLALCLFAIAFLARAVRHRERPGRDAAAFAVFALLALLVHYSTLIFLAGIGLSLTFLWGARRLCRAQVGSLIVANLLLGLTAALLYILHIEPHMMGRQLQAAVESAWLRPFFIADLDAFGHNLRSLHGYFAGAGWAGVAVVASVLGWLLCLCNRALVLALLGPFVLAAAALLSALELYPFGGSRHSTYLVAVLVPTIGCGFGRLLANRSTVLLGVALLGAMGLFRADLNQWLGGTEHDPPGIREVYVPTAEVDALIVELQKAGQRPGLLVMDRSTASTLAPVFSAERVPPTGLQAHDFRCFRWMERIAVVANAWGLVSGPGARGKPHHLGGFIERIGSAAPEIARALDRELLILTASQIPAGGARQFGAIKALPLLRGIRAPVVESLHQTPNFHLFRLDTKVYAAMLAALPRGANPPALK